MQATQLRNVKPGDYIRRKETSKATYTKGTYDKGSKTFSLIDCDDICREVFLKPSTVVYIGFDH